MDRGRGNLNLAGKLADLPHRFAALATSLLLELCLGKAGTSPSQSRMPASAALTLGGAVAIAPGTRSAPSFVPLSPLRFPIRTSLCVRLTSARP